MLKNVVDRGRPQATMWRMRIACSITKATDTHSEYVTLIAIPVQQMLHERASVLRCTYISCPILVSSIIHRGLTSGLLPSGNTINTLRAFIFSALPATCRAL